MSEENSPTVAASDIAVVGMAGRFPGAGSPDELWTNVRDGVESIRRLSDTELRAEGVDAATLADPDYVKACAVLDDLEMFDAGFFGFSPREASIMDPQHRHFLECAWAALEDAGHPPESFAGPIGVFGGCGMNAYFMYNLLTNPELMRSVGLFLVRHTGNDKDFLTTRVSYCFNLTGPSVGVQTACSTSLVAIHLACQHLLSGECDMALAGGVTIELPHRRGYHYQEGEILSPDGHCRAFDAESKGTVFGSGVGVVVVRRLQDALDDGDSIHAIIKGSAINNDGSSKVGYLAPSVDGQAKAILEALAVAGVRADTISYIEAHGTGTPVGDPIEIAALTQAFRKHTRKSGYCGIGSLKTNIGHLDTAAGVASFIKAIGALRHKQLPPSLHFAKPNAAIDFPSTPFYVNASLRDWKTDGSPRRAGVSSLGVGGTNAHVILEEAPEPAPAGAGKKWKLLVLSARSEGALDAATSRLAARFAERGDTNLDDAAYTLQVGRRAFEHRRVVACRDAADAAAVLASGDKKRVITGRPLQAAPSVVFLFPGGGAQYPNMGLELYEEEPVYREEIDRCLELLKRKCGKDLKPLLFPAPQEVESAARALEKPSWSILSIFITEYALARLWMSWGIEPAAMTGHSLGEYTAACLAGVLSLEDALGVVALRGEVFERLPEGGMLSVPLPEAELRPLLTKGLSIAAVNAPALCVASGPVGAIDALEKSLAAREIEAHRLRISVAAHSEMLEPHLEEFARRLASIELHSPKIPFVSNLTGSWAKGGNVDDGGYWARHLRGTVRFSDGLKEILKEPGRILLEVGPGTTLGSLARQHLEPGSDVPVIASMRHPQDSASDISVVSTALGRIWIAGGAVEWRKLHGASRRRRVSLPTYAFERERHWIDGRDAVYAPAPDASAQGVQKIADMSEWFSRPAWKRSDRPRSAGSVETQRARWLLFSSGAPLGVEVAKRLESSGHEVITVQPGSRFEAAGERAYRVDPQDPSSYAHLVKDLVEKKRVPDRIAHLWLTRVPSSNGLTIEQVHAEQHLGFYSLLFLAQALGAEDLAQGIALDVVTSGVQRVEREAVTHPERATALGLARVISREYPGLTCRAIDISDDDAARPGGEFLAALCDELRAKPSGAPEERVMALRGESRWTQTLEPLRLDADAETRAPLRDGGVYLITGGFGGVGMAIAQELARTHRAKLVLIGRTRPSKHAKHVEALEALGAEVLGASADVTDPGAVRAVVADARRRFGAIHGVFHAAGSIHDGLIQLKTAAEAERVLAPKVVGTCVLDAALEGSKPDFVVLFSSTSALLGLPGQADYAAANAFLDAFAASKASPGGTRYLAVNWGVWRDVGMAARAVAGTPSNGAAADAAGKCDGAEPCDAARPRDASNGIHPLLGSRVDRSPDRAVYEAAYGPETHWILDEHRLATGEALIPGTGYIEMARAALSDFTGAERVEIRDLVFLAPLEVADGSVKKIRITLEREPGGYTFSVSSDEGEHARGLVFPADGARVARCALQDIGERCVARFEKFGAGAPTKQEKHLRFGSRWKSLESVKYGSGEALAFLELPASRAADLDVYRAHPAPLDLATAAGLPLLTGYETCDDLYVPFSYKRVRILAPLPARFYSHVRCVGDASAAKDSALFDVTILSERGDPLIEIEELMVRRVTGGSRAFEREAAARRAGSTHGTGAGTLLEAWVREGIQPEEGMRALRRALDCGEAEVVISSIRIDDLLAGIERESAPKGAQRRDAAAKSRPGSDRGAPSDETEKAIATIWEDLLGVAGVGVDDDFFELGGHSLIAVRLVAKIEKSFKVKLRLATLFEARTVRQLAELVRGGKPAQKWIALVPIQPKGSRPPFFCVHGVGGEVLSYSELAKALAPHQPFYGFRAPGHDGAVAPLRRVEDQAALYIKEMQSVQPHGPYYLGGYSHGGRVVFEMAQQLSAMGETVGFLGIIDTWPSEGWSKGLRYWARWLENFPRWLAADVRRSGWQANVDRVRRFVRAIGKKARSLFRRAQGPGAAPDVTDEMDISSLPESVRNTFQANFEAFCRYAPRMYPGRVTLFRAKAQPLLSPHERDLGWGRFAARGVTVLDLPGNHSSLLTQPDVKALASALLAALDEAQAAPAAHEKPQPAEESEHALARA